MGTVGFCAYTWSLAPAVFCLEKNLHELNPLVKLHCNPLQGKYRFFTGNSLCSTSTLTCFGSVQGLKGTNFIEIQGNICILYRN